MVAVLFPIDAIPTLRQPAVATSLRHFQNYLWIFGREAAQRPASYSRWQRHPVGKRASRSCEAIARFELTLCRLSGSLTPPRAS